MPLRDFHCELCECTTERLLRHDEPDPQKCEQPSKRLEGLQCGGKLTRQISKSTGFILVGHSWAKNGYGGNPNS